MKKVIGTFIILTTITLNIMAQQKIVQTAGRTQMEEFATDAQEILPGTVIHILANKALARCCKRQLVCSPRL